MFTLILWWVTITFGLLVVVRGGWSPLMRRFPIFYSYLAYVLVESVSRFYVFKAHPGAYANFYWFTQLLSVAMGCAVIFEVYQVALERSPGARRATEALVLIIFVSIATKVCFLAMSNPNWSFARTMADLERNLRSVQAILIVAVFIIGWYYAIPWTRNLFGLVFGYGLFVGVSVLSLTIGAYFGRFEGPFWRYVQPITYLLSLLIWTGSMWSYSAANEPELESKIERDYEFVAARTKRLLTELREQLLRTVRF